jgi:muramoyltetrapeptide carboxypeptidase LdcA involved in peptidoglycan recycling
MPILHRAPVGHGGRNVAVPLGAAVSLDAGEGTLRLEEPTG